MRGVKRESVSDSVATFYPSGDIWTVDSLVDVLQSLQAKHLHYDYLYVELEEYYLRVFGRREETDKEYEKRCSKIKKRIEAKRKVEEESEETRRKLYEELKKEFG